MRYFLLIVTLLTTTTSFVHFPSEKLVGEKQYREITVKCDLQDYVLKLSNYHKDSAFRVALARTVQQYNEGGDFYASFDKNYHKIAPQGSLKEIFKYAKFGTPLSLHANNEEVLFLLKEELGASVDYTAQIMEERLDRLKLKNLEVTPDPSGSIKVRYRFAEKEDLVDLHVLSRGKVHFWETFSNKELFDELRAINTAINEVFFKDDLASQNALLIDMELPVAAGQISESPVIGSCSPQDTARIMSWFRHPEVRKLLPPKTKLMWSKYLNVNGKADLFALRTDKQSLDGDLVEKATQLYDQSGEHPIVAMMIGEEAMKDWYWITSKNVNRYLSVEMDGAIISAPRITEAEAAGRAQFFTRGSSLEEKLERAQYLANILTSEAYPCGVSLVKSEVVTE